MVEPRLQGPEQNCKQSYAGTFDSHKRAFSDNPNHNHRFYRGKSFIIFGHSIDFVYSFLTESEVLSKVGIDQRHLRENEGLAGIIYHDVHHPMCYCEEY